MASGKRENEARGHGLGDQNEQALLLQVDAAVLHHQNQRLVQQLEAQKAEMHTLEGKFKELREEQDSYDKTLITVNKMWNQLVDDLVLLGVRAGGDLRYLQALDHEDLCTEALASCPPEETFLYRLLRAGPIEKNEGDGSIKYVQEALARRHSATLDLMKHVQETIAARRAKNDCLAMVLHGQLSSEDAIMQVQKLNDYMREVANNMHQAIDIIHQKHKQYADEINKYLERHSSKQSEIKRLSGELEESMAELEESRRKLAILQMQKHGTSVMNASVASAVNGSNSPDKPADRTVGLRELKISVEEAKTLAASRLFELQEAQEENLNMSKQVEDLQNKLKDDKYIVTSKPYSLLSDKLQQLNMELEQYKGLMESLQAERNHILRREKELNAKAESADAAKISLSTYEAKIEELELQIQKFIAERNDLEIKLEEAIQDSGRKDIKDEIHVMASALYKEMEMLETQLNRSKIAARDALKSREDADSLRAILDRKISEHKILSDKCAEQMVEIKSHKAQIEKLEKEKQELQIFLDMYAQECFDTRTIMEIKESEHRARAQAEILKTVLDEHSLELRVKAANEAEAACQQRLSTAEAEIAELQAKLDASERDVWELKEAIKIKDAEGKAYISEIETIGQAYEDMQTQNQHLLQQVADRDDYNIKLVSDSVKMKQTYSSLLSEKQAKAKQLQQINGSLEFYKMKVAHGEEQMKAYVAQACKASLENRHITINLNKAKVELADSEKELMWLQSAYDASQKEYEQNQKRIADLRLELERERNERKRLEEELEEVKSEVMEMSGESEETTIQKLQDEIKECKAILKCGVCFDRPKEVVITKCFHLFCYPCIQRNLEIRHRKCPGCGTPFGQSDVREVKI
ncbi:E3 ubiquitin-protein ligase BRE1-like 2 isoform X1 [Elaeis guineensis]|uniref:E3 ubiquitin protein ligase n=1 Tax=Elaeis guineensis var. tenera TaxID=51953 RepID=A0A6I9S3G8_ELAGV|nr:E3 ubiquitin-protein ligase BRE1-like 2 isoform X1 [Elaeis guineensis]